MEHVAGLEDGVALYARRGAVALITMDRPRHGAAQNDEMTYALDPAFFPMNHLAHVHNRIADGTAS